MKTTRILLILIGTILISGCSKYAQLVYTSPTGAEVKKDNGYYVYENDTVKVVYAFWDERGVMSFMIRNNSSVPIYIDWKKSAFINRDKRINYYTGKTTSNFNARTRSSAFGFGSAFGGYLSATSSGSSRVSGSEVVVKEERYTFIPPKSYVFKKFDNLIGHIHFDINNRQTSEKEIDGVSVYESIPTTGIEFRNFLTYSTTEEFEKESYVDNGFRIKKVVTMKKKDFNTNDERGESYCPWQAPTKFYILDIKKDDLIPSY